MTKSKIDLELIAAVAVDINSRYKTLANLLERDHQELLRHIAAAAIHTTFFMTEVYNASSDDDKVNLPSNSQKFLETCGCDFNKNKE